jgi:hypothetical protein
MSILLVGLTNQKKSWQDHAEPANGGKRAILYFQCTCGTQLGMIRNSA